MVEVHSSPRVAIRTSAKSAQSLIVVLFLVLVLYIFFFGKGNGKDKANSVQHEGTPGKQGHSRACGPVSFRDNEEQSSSKESHTDASVSNPTKDKDRKRRKLKEKSDGRTTSSETSSDSSQLVSSPRSDGNRKSEKKRDKTSSKSKKSKSRKFKETKEKPDWLQPSSPPLLSPIPDHRSVSPSKSIIRKRGSDDSLPPSPNTAKGNRIHWVDYEELSPHEVTKHVRKWQDYVGVTDQTTEGTFENSPVKRKEKWESHQKILVNPAEWAAKELRRKGKLDEGLLKAMEQAEEISMAKPRDSLWVKALQDEWDEHLGTVPAVAMVMAKRIGKHISFNNIALLADTMTIRASMAPSLDKKRSYSKFIQSVGVDKEDPLYPYKLVLAWYCDTFRCKHYSERMGICDEPVQMASHDKLGPMAQMLGWMEYLGRLNMTQRLFVGLDLSGLAMRAQAMREGEGYRLDLTIFLPGGPPSSVDNTAEDWANRMDESAKAFRTVHLELAKMFDKTKDDMIYRDPFVRRKLIFRPGWTLNGVNSAKLDKPEPKASVAQRQLVTRVPRVLELPADINDRIPPALRKPTGNVRKALSRLAPGEVCFQSIRQYAWDKSTITAENSTFNPVTFWIAWSYSGEKIQYSKNTDIVQDQRAHDFVRSLDLGGYVPIHIADPQKFLRIGGFPALEVLLLSYLPKNQIGATVDLVLEPSFGLLQELEKSRQSSRYLYDRPSRLKLFVSVADARAAREFVLELDKRLAQEGRQYLASGSSLEQVVEFMAELASKALGEIYLVDESKSGEIGEGQLPKGVSLNYDVRRAVQILIDPRAIQRPPPIETTPENLETNDIRPVSLERQSPLSYREENSTMRPSPDSSVIPPTTSTPIMPSYSSAIPVDSSSGPSTEVKRRVAFDVLGEEQIDSPRGRVRSHYPPPPSVENVTDEDDVK
ncbi:hypothetical protein AYX13_02715 [Cryptococcus neoformans]|nr:hypothetical protein AYX13_02715 [Cryptococcus neoformans var. grubii]